MNKPFQYQKPREICQDISVYSQFLNSGNFVGSYKKFIEDKILSGNFTLRMAELNDIYCVQELIKQCYSAEGAKDSNSYDFYRFIKFGHGLIVEDEAKRMIGCLFEEAYDSPDRTSYTLRLAIDHNITCKELGTLLLEYSCLLAMERGSGVKRGLLLTDNFISTHILINKLGWICDGFYPELKWVPPSFTISLPLTIESFIYNRLDMKKLPEFINAHRTDTCVRLIEWNDLAGLEKVFEDDFVVIAFIRGGIISDKNLYVAMPVETIKIEP